MRAAVLTDYRHDFSIDMVPDPSIVAPLAARGAVEPTTTTFPLEGVDEALHALDDGRMIGRGVLVPNES